MGILILIVLCCAQTLFHSISVDLTYLTRELSHSKADEATLSTPWRILLDIECLQALPKTDLEKDGSKTMTLGQHDTKGQRCTPGL